MTTTFARKNLQAIERSSDLTSRIPSMRQDLGGKMKRAPAARRLWLTAIVVRE